MAARSRSPTAALDTSRSRSGSAPSPRRWRRRGEGKYEILETIITGADESEVFGAIEAFYAANPDVNMITGVDYYSNIIAQFIKNNNLQGQLLAGGSISPGSRSTGCASYVAFGLGQNPYLQGFYPS